MDTNVGNFKALLNFRADRVDELQKHLETAPKNATYTSKTTQNQIISIIGHQIRNHIIEECLQFGGFYSLSADEVRDTSNKEQLAVSIRFVGSQNTIREQFVGFIDVSEGTTGEHLSKHLLDMVTALGLDPEKMRSQCYDGAGNMAGKNKGDGPRIREQFPKALTFWCAAHQLNRCVVMACTIPSVRNMMGTADQVVRFFEFSPRKQVVLEEQLDIFTASATSRSKLKELCRTRWVERHDAFAIFLELLPAISEALEIFAKHKNARRP